MVHFIVNWRKHHARRPARWLVASIEIDQLMVILTMSTGVILARDILSDSRLKRTVERIINGRTDYLCENRVFDVICALRDGSERALPSEKECP